MRSPLFSTLGRSRHYKERSSNSLTGLCRCRPGPLTSLRRAALSIHHRRAVEQPRCSECCAQAP